MVSIDITTAEDGSKLLISGKDNSGRPRQQFADKLAAADEGQYLKIAEDYIWLSAYAANNPRSDYHWMCDACYQESQRRGSTGEGSLYDRAHKRASGLL